MATKVPMATKSSNGKKSYTRGFSSYEIMGLFLPGIECAEQQGNDFNLDAFGYISGVLA